ncbi:MAG: leucine-rich repeat domain-containing protein [Clostridiales bacterium]|nr:leucine-rich repeat domain-containing protein [Clostridiales bacterium]
MKNVLWTMLCIAALLMLCCAWACADGLMLPLNVTTIEQEAFYGDTSLGEVVLPDGIKRIESRAFAYTGVTRIYLPRSLTYIAPDAFQGCSLTAWSDYYSYGRTYCASNGIPFESGTLVSAGDFTFEFTSATEATITSYNGSATAIVIPRMADGTHTITRIGDYAFGDTIINEHGHYSKCENYTAVSIPDTVTEIGRGAFLNCKQLRSVSLPPSVTKIGKSAFGHCSSLVHVELNEGLTEICDFAFGGCAALTEIRIPSTLGEYNDKEHYEQFRDCTGLKRVSVANGVTLLSSQMFQDCTSLREVNLPDSCDFSNAFTGCTSLTHIRIPLAMDRVGLGGTGISSVSDIELHDGVKSLGLSGTPIRELILPDTVTSISEHAFSHCAQLEYAYIPDTADLEPGMLGVFMYCPMLKDVRLPDRWTRLCTQMFQGCTSLETIHLPSSLTELPYLGFQDCTGLKHLVIPDGVSSVYADTFPNCTNLESLTIPANATLGGDFSVFPKLTLTVHYGSPAETFARENNIPYISMDHPAVITAQPVNAQGAEGASASFTVEAQHAAGYHWQVSKDGGATWTNLTNNSTSATYTVTISETRAQWRYRCAVTGDDGKVVYTNVVQLVLLKPATITVQPRNASGHAGDTATFTVSADNATGYRWQVSKDSGTTWTDLSATTATYSTTISEDNSGWRFRCAVTGGDGSVVYTNTAKLSLVLPAAITAQPENARGEEGDTATFTVTAENAASYRWQVSKDGGATWTDLTSNASSPTYTATITQTRAGWLYRCRVTGADGASILTDVVRMLISIVGDSVEIYSAVPSASQVYTDDPVVFTLYTSPNVTNVFLVARSDNALWSPYDYSAIWRADECAVLSEGQLLWTCDYEFLYSSYDEIYFYALGAVRNENGSVSQQESDDFYPEIEVLAREMEDLTELSSYFYKSLEEAAALTQSAVAQHEASYNDPAEWRTWNGGVTFASRDMSPFRVQYIRLSDEDTTHSVFGVTNAMTLSQKRSKLIAQDWTQGSNEFVYDSPDGDFTMLVYDDSIEASWSVDAAFAFVESVGVTMEFDEDEYIVIGTGSSNSVSLQLNFTPYGWEYLNDSMVIQYDRNALRIENPFDDTIGGPNNAYFTAEGLQAGSYDVVVQYYIANRLYATATTTVRVITDPSTLEHTEVSGLFGKRMDQMYMEFPIHTLLASSDTLGDDVPIVGFSLDWRYHSLRCYSMAAPYGTGGYYVDMIEIGSDDYYHSLYGLYTGMPYSERRALLEANGWTSQGSGLLIYNDGCYANASLGRVIEWDDFGIYCYMTPAAAAALNAPSDITLLAMPQKRTYTMGVDERATIMVWLACGDPDKDIAGSGYSIIYNNYAVSGFDTALLSRSGSGSNGDSRFTWLYFRLKGLGSTQVTVDVTGTPYGDFTAETGPITIVAEDSWA